MSNNKKNVVSDKARIEAAFQLFPWLEKEYRGIPFKKFLTHYVNNDILDIQCFPWHNEHSLDPQGLGAAKVIFFTEAGQKVTEVGISRVDENEAETIAAALKRAEKEGLGETYYIAGLLYDSHKDEWSLNLSRPEKKGVTLTQALSKEIEEAKNEINMLW